MLKRLGSKKWFTIAESAAALGISPLKVYRLVVKGRLVASNLAPANQKKPVYRISRETLKRAIQQLRDGLPVS